MDSTEELEPLFDYHRVQPVRVFNLEDDSDTSPAYVPKRRKFDKPSDIKKVDDDDDDEGKTFKPLCLDIDDDEEDWLPPPPKYSVSTTRREEDSAIKQVRLKKQELASLVQSAEIALREADEASKRASTMSSDLYEEQMSPERTEEPAKPAADRPKIVLSIQEKGGTKQYRIYSDDKFEQLFKKYAEKAKIDSEKLIFKFDGDKINPADTPKSLGMEDEDIIEVHMKAK